MNITTELLTKALRSFPEKPEDALIEDLEFQDQFCKAMEDNTDFTAWAAYCRERLMESPTAKRFIQIAVVMVQLGYRLHSMEMAESLVRMSSGDAFTLDDDGEPN